MNEFIARKGLVVLSGGAVVSGGLNVDTFVSAGFFHGDGSNLTNIPYNNLTGIPAGLVSSSTQINTGSFAGTFIGTASWAETASIATGINFIPVTASYALTAGATGGGVTGGGEAGRLVKWTSTSGVSASIVDENGSRVQVFGPLTASALQGDGAGVTGVVTSSYAETASYAANAGAINFSTGSYTGSFKGAFTGPLQGNADTSTTASFINANNITLGTLNNARLPSQINVTGVTASFVGSLKGNADTSTTASFVSRSYVADTFIAGNASNLNAGTLNNARLPSQISVTGVTASFVGTLKGTATTASFVDASNITLGTLNNARLPSQINVTGVTASLEGNAKTATTASYAFTDWSAVANKPSALVSSSAQTVANIAGQTISPTIISSSGIYVDGDITARQFNTQFVSASIIYQSGSTKFGDTSDDVMSVTGSMNVSGSATFQGPVTFAGGVNTTAIAGSLYTTASLTVNIGTTVITTVNTGSYDMAHFKYVTKRGTNLRTGMVIATWDTAGNVEYTDTSTNDVGSTTDVDFSVDVLNSNARLKATVVNTNSWLVKTIIQAI